MQDHTSPRISILISFFVHSRPDRIRDIDPPMTNPRAHFQPAGGEPGSKRQSFQIMLLCSIKIIEIGGRGIVVESSVDLISKLASFISHDQRMNGVP